MKAIIRSTALIVLTIFTLAKAKTYTATLWVSGMGYAEGPSVDAQENLFVCTGSLLHLVKKITPQGVVSDFATLIGPNGSEFDTLGNLLVTDATGKKVVRISKQGTITTIADRTHTGAAFRNPNDLTIGLDGTIYFTDSDTDGAIYFIPLGGAVKLFATSRSPNGLTLNLAQNKLIVATALTATGGIRPENDTVTLFEYAITPSGGTNRRALVTNSKWGDGMKTDMQGNYWYCLYDKGKAFRISPMGQYLDTIIVANGAGGLSNLCFGGPDNRTVFLTQQGTGYRAVYKAVVDIPGVPNGDRRKLFSGIQIPGATRVAKPRKTAEVLLLGSRREGTVGFDLQGRLLTSDEKNPNRATAVVQVTQ